MHRGCLPSPRSGLSFPRIPPIFGRLLLRGLIRP
jgi:hypothetical protein